MKRLVGNAVQFAMLTNESPLPKLSRHIFILQESLQIFIFWTFVVFHLQLISLESPQRRWPPWEKNESDPPNQPNRKNSWVPTLIASSFNFYRAMIQYFYSGTGRLLLLAVGIAVNRLKQQKRHVSMLFSYDFSATVK
jgi:hypothetical protein